MAFRNVAIGLGGIAVVIAAVAAIAAGLDWDPRDVAAADAYRSHERERAQRYRAQIAGEAPPEAASRRGEPRPTARVEPPPEPPPSRRDRAREVRDWWDRTAQGVDTERLERWIGEMGDWWRDEAVPAWERWAREQDARVGEGERLVPGRGDHAGAQAHRADPREARRAPPSPPPPEPSYDPAPDDPALRWWTEERDRMRRRR